MLNLHNVERCLARRKNEKKTIILIASVLIIAIIVAVALSQIISEIQNPKIFCLAWESGTSNWQKEEGYPVLSSYNAGAPNSSWLPNVNLVVSVSNNNSISLFNVKVEVTYRTIENNWKTTPQVELGFLDIQQEKTAGFTLMSPDLLLWQTKRPIYNNPETHWENVTVYVLNATELKITAYGYAKP